MSVMGDFTLREALVWINTFGPGVELLAARASLYAVEGTRSSAHTLLATLTAQELARPALLRTARSGAGTIPGVSDPLGWIYVLPSGETDDIDELAHAVGSPAFFIVLTEAAPETIVQETVQAHAQARAVPAIPAIPASRAADGEEHEDR